MAPHAPGALMEGTWMLLRVLLTQILLGTKKYVFQCRGGQAIASFPL